MARAILISIRPKWTGSILSGKKTLELRKNRPKLKTPFTSTKQRRELKLTEQARKEPTQVKSMAVGWLLLSSYVTKSSVFQFHILQLKRIWICPSMRTHAFHMSRFGAIARIAMLSFGTFPA